MSASRQRQTHEEEADQLISEMEEQLRDRLGVAIYGTGEETVADVVGKLLNARGLRLSVVDTLTEGQLATDLTEAGWKDRLQTSEKR